MHKDASVTAHAQDTTTSQNEQARYTCIGQVVLMTACPITGSVLKYRTEAQQSFLQLDCYSATITVDIEFLMLIIYIVMQNNCNFIAIT